MTQEGIITTEASIAFAQNFRSEDEHLAHARAKAAELGAVPVTPASAQMLGFLASAIDAHSVAEIGTGAGVSGLYLLRALAADGVLTSVDLEAENQRVAREVFTAAGFASQRFRLITGAALDVLPRLISDGYDLVFVDADKTEYPEYLGEALRLAKPGGLVVFDNVLWNDKVADPTHRDPQTLAIRELIAAVQADEDLASSVLLSIGDGLLALHKPQ